MPAGKITIGLPFVSGVSYSYANNGFKYNDILRRNDAGILILDLKNAITKMNSRNNLSINAESELLLFGIRSGKNYFIFNATEKAGINLIYSKSIIEFLNNGNAASLGTLQQLNPELEGSHYREYGLSWACNLNKAITTGIRVKYLYGMENIITRGNGVTLYTDPLDYNIVATSDLTIYTSGLDSGAFSNFNATEYIFNKRNYGYGIDGGITIRLSPKFEMTASVIDFGKISWSSANAVYHTSTNGNSFVYSGINLDEFINNDSLNAETYLEVMVDSLYNSFNTKTSGETYTTATPVKFYIGACYNITPAYKISGLIRNTKVYHGNRTDYQLSFTGKIKKLLNYTISINRINKTPITPGAGFTLNYRNTQIYFVSDNCPGLFNWKNANITGFRAGLNIILGTRLKKLKAPQPLLEAPLSIN